MPDTTPLPLPECPHEDCTWTVHHCHVDGAAYSRRYAPRTQPTPLDALLAAAEDAKRSHDRLRNLAETLLPESSPVKTAENPAPVVLPTVDEVARLVERHTYGYPDGVEVAPELPALDAASAVLDLISARVPHWVPIEWDAIRPGMTVRATSAHARIELVVGEVDLYTVRGVHGGVWMRDVTFGRTWEVDPRTVPAEPEDPGVAVVVKWWRGSIEPVATDKDAARDLLARIDAARADQ